MKLPIHWKLPVVARISIGLVGLMVSVLMLAALLGYFPDSYSESMRHRKQFCESAAIGFTHLADRAGAQVLRDYLESLSKRNPDVKSLAVRRGGGTIVAETGNHAAHWNEFETKAMTDRQAGVTLYSAGKPWGTFETVFSKPLVGNIASWWTPELSHMAIAGLACLGVFYFYLRAVLRHLDPSKVVPRRVREALDALAEGLVILDRHERIALANTAFADAVGSNAEQLIGKPISTFSFINKDDAPTSTFPWREAAQLNQSVRGRLLGLDVTGAERATFSVSASPILDDKGKCRGILTSFENVTELEEKKLGLSNMIDALRTSSNVIKQQNRELEKLATRDPLTDCLNRRSFFELFDTHWKSAQRYDRPLSAIMVDIDFFKSINDNHGHGMGDEVLRKVAITLNETIRESDIVCRYGGEEFALLLPNTCIEEATIVAEKVRGRLELLTFPHFSVTASLGVSAHSAETSSPQDLLDEADNCLYLAKRGGRNQVVCWDNVPDGLVVDNSVVSRIANDNEFEPVSIPYHAVTALISALAYRDQDTASHSRRVADLCVAVGESIMSLSECYTLEIAALLHDIGKIGVADSILLKPGPLTDEEWAVIRHHDKIGVEIISASFSSPQLTTFVKYYQSHFFREDQSSDTLSGHDIPLGARILAIADAYDSMINNHVYREGCSPKDALSELRRCAGTQFDPELVEHFIATINDRQAFRQREPDLVTKEIALNVGLQLEQLYNVLDEQDFGALAALSHRLESTARKCGLDNIGAKASHLGKALEVEQDAHEILGVANELLDLCRSTQQSFLVPQEG